MKNQSIDHQVSVSLVLRYCQEIETILGLRFGVKGRNLKEKINRNQDWMPNELKQKIIRIMMLGERAICDPKFQIHDWDNFSRKCDLVIQELNCLADRFYSNIFRYNLLHLIRRRWLNLLLFWLSSLLLHLRGASLALFNEYQLFFWITLGCSFGAVLLLGFILKSRRFHQEKLDQILENILIVMIMLNPLTLSVVAIALFVLNVIDSNPI